MQDWNQQVTETCILALIGTDEYSSKKHHLLLHLAMHENSNCFLSQSNMVSLISSFKFRVPPVDLVESVLN